MVHLLWVIINLVNLLYLRKLVRELTGVCNKTDKLERVFAQQLDSLILYGMIQVQFNLFS